MWSNDTLCLIKTGSQYENYGNCARYCLIPRHLSVNSTVGKIVAEAYLLAIVRMKTFMINIGRNLSGYASRSIGCHQITAKVISLRT
jgi:predicted molibdopterin-dependent oxidoreductase YjgC